jgi:hypothetical protein
MLILYETAAGYALFKLVNDAKLEKADDIWKDFETAEKANQAYVLLFDILYPSTLFDEHILTLFLFFIFFGTVSNSRLSPNLKTPPMLYLLLLVSWKARSPRT